MSGTPHEITVTDSRVGTSDLRIAQSIEAGEQAFLDRERRYRLQRSLEAEL
jgi:hypothetical protein